MGQLSRGRSPVEIKKEVVLSAVMAVLMGSISVALSATTITDVRWIPHSGGYIEVLLDRFPSWNGWELFVNGQELPTEGGTGNLAVRPNGPVSVATGVFIATDPWVTGLADASFPCRGTLQFDIPDEGRTNVFVYDLTAYRCRTSQSWDPVASEADASSSSGGEAAFAGSWEGRDADAGDDSVTTLVITAVGNRLAGTLSDTYSVEPDGTVISPGYAGAGSGTLTSTSTAQMTFFLTRSDGDRVTMVAELTLSGSNLELRYTQWNEYQVAPPGLWASLHRVGAVGEGATEQESATAISLILHNGVVQQMTEPWAIAEAIAISGERIAAVGSDSSILGMAGPTTQLIDLRGEVVLPGFIDPHTHFLKSCEHRFGTASRAQEEALGFGITTMAEMSVDPAVIDDPSDPWRRWADQGILKIRHRLYVGYNYACGDPNPATPSWMSRHAPDEEIGPNLLIGGIKIFAERSVCGDLPIAASLSPQLREELRRYDPNSQYLDTDLHSPLFTPSQLASVLRSVSQAGFQAAMHAWCEYAAETCIEAIDQLHAQGIQTQRPLVLHNAFLRTDQINEYSRLGIMPLVEPFSPCCEVVERVAYGDAFIDKYYTRWRDLVHTVGRVALDSDWPEYGEASLNPLLGVQTVVTGRQAIPPPEFCDAPSGCCSVSGWSALCRTIAVPQTVTAWEGLRMITAEAARALRCENDLGTIEPGKLADLVVLSDNPLTAEPETIDDLQVMITIIGGEIEYTR
jgi:predicted amidohydrolase YtcJ